MSNSLHWFRLYHRIIDDEKIRLLAFEDRWHFVALCCLKANGLLDEPDNDFKDRKIAIKLGVQTRELDEIKRRLSEVGLVDETFQPVAWDDLQFKSDTSSDRVRKFREKSKGSKVKRDRNVSVTRQETDTDTDTESEKDRGAIAQAELAFIGKVIRLKASDFERWRQSYHAIPDLMAELTKADDYYSENPPKEGKWFFPVSKWLEKAHKETLAGKADPYADVYRGVL